MYSHIWPFGHVELAQLVTHIPAVALDSRAHTVPTGHERSLTHDAPVVTLPSVCESPAPPSRAGHGFASPPQTKPFELEHAGSEKPRTRAATT
jgi:hypothetical protein